MRLLPSATSSVPRQSLPCFPLEEFRAEREAEKVVVVGSLQSIFGRAQLKGGFTAAPKESVDFFLPPTPPGSYLEMGAAIDEQCGGAAPEDLGVSELAD